VRAQVYAQLSAIIVPSEFVQIFKISNYLRCALASSCCIADQNYSLTMLARSETFRDGFDGMDSRIAVL